LPESAANVLGKLLAPHRDLCAIAYPLAFEEDRPVPADIEFVIKASSGIGG